MEQVKKALNVVSSVCDTAQSQGLIKNLNSAVTIADALKTLAAAIDELEKRIQGKLLNDK